MYVKFLLQQFPREGAICHVAIEMLVPRLRLVSGYIITKEVNQSDIQWVTFGDFSLGIGHALNVAAVFRFSLNEYERNDS